jgi:hypothetical protein
MDRKVVGVCPVSFASSGRTGRGAAGIQPATEPTATSRNNCGKGGQRTTESDFNDLCVTRHQTARKRAAIKAKHVAASRITAVNSAEHA